ncbi:MAG: hypothetical protein IKD04_07955 [Clostridia bacterium]|nr:hypothetical protein [Clostridia bacterium]
MSNSTTNFSFQKNISLIELFYESVKRWYIIIPIIVASVLLSLFYSVFLATPLYTSTAKLYVTNKESQIITSSDLSVSNYLSNDFAEILTDTSILDQVSAEMNGKYSSGQLRGFISINQPSNTRIIEISVLSPNAQDSKKIADSLCNISQNSLVDIMGLDRVKIIRQGSLSSAPSSPRTTHNALLAFLVGIAISVLTVFILYIADNKVSSSKDVEKYLGLSVLATIPYNQSRAKKKY